MKRLIILMGLVFVAVAGWRIADRLSSDALGMAIGVLFGIVAGIPAALLLLASSKRRAETEDTPRANPQGRFPQNAYGYPAFPQQPPVIVLAGNGAPGQMPMQPGYGHVDQQPRYALPAPREMEERKFRVVGEKDEWIDEW
ncbi:hypothetical protein BH10CHL1_BH10CHL1_46410 [soil metagenome]